METPSLQKAANRGKFTSFDAETNQLTATVPQFDPETGAKVQLPINYNVVSLQEQADVLEEEITEKRRQKNDILALLDKFKPDVDLAKSAIVVEETVTPTEA